jgi:hypothetical protein
MQARGTGPADTPTKKEGAGGTGSPRHTQGERQALAGPASKADASLAKQRAGSIDAGEQRASSRRCLRLVDEVGPRGTGARVIKQGAKAKGTLAAEQGRRQPRHTTPRQARAEQRAASRPAPPRTCRRRGSASEAQAPARHEGERQALLAGGAERQARTSSARPRSRQAPNTRRRRRRAREAQGAPGTRAKGRRWRAEQGRCQPRHTTRSGLEPEAALGQRPGVAAEEGTSTRKARDARHRLARSQAQLEAKGKRWRAESVQPGRSSAVSHNSQARGRSGAAAAPETCRRRRRAGHKEPLPGTKAKSSRWRAEQTQSHRCHVTQRAAGSSEYRAASRPRAEDTSTKKARGPRNRPQASHEGRRKAGAGGQGEADVSLALACPTDTTRRRAGSAPAPNRSHVDEEVAREGWSPGPAHQSESRPAEQDRCHPRHTARRPERAARGSSRRPQTR